MRPRGLGQPHLRFRQREGPAAVAPGRRGGVDLRALPGAHPQAHAAGRQVLHEVDQVGEGAAEAVEFPDHEHVARPERAHAAVKSRAVVAYAGRDVVVDVAGVDARGLQRVARRGPATGSRPPWRRGRSRSACVVNGRLRHAGMGRGGY